MPAFAASFAASLQVARPACGAPNPSGAAADPSRRSTSGPRAEHRGRTRRAAHSTRSLRSGFKGEAPPLAERRGPFVQPEPPPRAAGAVCSASGQRPAPSSSSAPGTRPARAPRPAPPPLDFDIDTWASGYESQTREISCWIEDVEGTIPPELEGTLFRNGPGLMEVGGVRVNHPFDGDGMVASIAFKDGRAYFRNRFVRTEGYVRERAAGRRLYRNTFGTERPGGWPANFLDLNQKNVANTNVIYWGDKLLALWEASQPYRLNPRTLETEGLELLGGVLSAGTPFAIGVDALDELWKPGTSFSAHPHVDPATGRLVTFGFQPTVGGTLLRVYEFEADFSLHSRRTIHLPGFAFFHDFAFTENHCLFFQNPVDFNPVPFALGQRSAAACMRFNSERPTKILAIPRAKTKGDRRLYPSEIPVYETSPGFVFHFMNAYEEPAGEGGTAIVVDAVRLPTLPDLTEILADGYENIDWTNGIPNYLYRFRVDTGTKKVSSRRLSERMVEFPAVNPDRFGRRHRYGYAAAPSHPTAYGPHQAIGRVDVETGDEEWWSAGRDEFVTEPVFVGRPGAGDEADGWLLALLYDGARRASDLVVRPSPPCPAPPRFSSRESAARPVPTSKYPESYIASANYTQVGLAPPRPAAPLPAARRPAPPRPAPPRPARPARFRFRELERRPPDPLSERLAVAPSPLPPPSPKCRPLKAPTPPGPKPSKCPARLTPLRSSPAACPPPPKPLLLPGSRPSLGRPVQVLEAGRVAAGPAARLRLPLHLPYGLHGSFAGEYFGP
eukprot:tig00020904_g15292.t1